MNDTLKAKTPGHLWLVGVVTLLWNAVGVIGYLTVRLNMLESLGMSPDQIAHFASFPMWANAVWALGVWGAFFASVLLLLRSRWAATSAVVAIIGLLGTTVFQYAMIEVPQDLRNVGLDVAIWATTLFLLWYTHRMRSAGVLR